MVKLANSAVMTADGVYKHCTISRDEFARLVREAADRGVLESYVGYPDTANHIRAVTGVEVPLSRKPMDLRPGDTILVCRLGYRVMDPGSKGQFKPSDDDFVYSVVYYDE